MYNLHFDEFGRPQVDYVQDGADVADYYVHAATVQLDAYRDAVQRYEDANERYQRALARAESGRAPRYGNPLGVKVQSSGGGHPADDIFAVVADLKTAASNAGTAVIVAKTRVEELIRRACTPGGKYATALQCYYLTYPGMSYADMSRKYPDLYHTKAAAVWATGRAEGQVAEYLRRADNDTAERYLSSLPEDRQITLKRGALLRAFA